MHFTVYYADDFSIGANTLNTPGEWIQDAIDHYNGWGGGYTPTIVMLLMKFSPVVWKLFIVALVSLFVILSSRIICKNNQKKRAVVALIEWILFFGMSISLSREIVYWQDGAVAYMLSTVQAFTAFYFIYTRLYMGDKKIYDKFLIPFVCLFGGWSSAQSGVITAVFVPAMVLWKRFVKKEKVKAFYWVCAALAVIGFCIFYFAPGNYVRMEVGFSEYAHWNIFNKILYRIGDVFSLLFDGTRAGAMLTPFFIYSAFGLISLRAYNKAKELKNKKTKRVSNICSALVALFIIGFLISLLPIPQLSSFAHFAYHYPNMKYVPFGAKFLAACAPFIIATVAIAATIINAWILTFKVDKKDPLLLGLLLTFLAAQFAMILSPYAPYRTLAYTVLFAIAFIAYMLTYAWEEKIRILPLAVILLSYISIYLGIVFGVLYLVADSYIKVKESNKYRFDLIIFIICFGLYAGGNYCKILTAFRANNVTYNYNIELIESFKASNPDCEHGCTLYLLPPAEPDYAISWFVGEDWVNDSIRFYFDLPPQTKLMYDIPEEAEK